MTSTSPGSDPHLPGLHGTDPGIRTETAPVLAQWIAPSGATAKTNYYFRARKTFEVGEIPENLTLIIAAESSYILYLNGTELGRGPARGTHTINYYDSYPVRTALKLGKNQIGVLCHCMNIETFVAAPAEPALIAEIPGLLKTDASWQVTPAPEEWRSDPRLYTVQTGFSEWRDLRSEPIGWQTFEDSATWESAFCLGPSSEVLTKRLLPRAIPHLEETVNFPVAIPSRAAVPKAKNLEDIDVARLMSNEDHGPSGPLSERDLSALRAGNGITITPPPEEGGVALVFDFGREIVGRLELEISGGAGTVVDIGHEEQLNNQRLHVAHEDAKGERYDFADRYILRSGRQRIGNSLMERGFRMVQIVARNFTSPLTIHRVRAIDRRYPLRPRAAFQCSDPLLNKIWSACVETLSACTTDIFTDCPWRERSFWVNDLLVENLIFLQLSGDRALPARALQMIFSETAKNGLVNGVCPCPIKEKRDDWLSLPATNLFLALIVRDYLYYTGDAALVRNYLPNIRRILVQFENFTDARGLVTFPSEYWNFFDWSFEANGRSLRGKTSAALSYLLQIAHKAYEELAAYAGANAGAPAGSGTKHRFAAVTEALYDHASRRLSDAIENGTLAPSGSQLSHALALLAESDRGKYSNDLERGLSDPDLLVPELYLHHFLFAAQKKAGHTADGLERIRKYWGKIVASGSPTVWEFGVYQPGKDALEGKGSLCHGFATSPIDFFQTVILGITPLQPGFSEFLIDPHAFDLSSAAGCVPAPTGDIAVSWRRSPDGLLVTLHVPRGCRAVTRRGKHFDSGEHRFEVS